MAMAEAAMAAQAGPAFPGGLSGMFDAAGFLVAVLGEQITSVEVAASEVWVNLARDVDASGWAQWLGGAFVVEDDPVSQDTRWHVQWRGVPVTLAGALRPGAYESTGAFRVAGAR